MFSEQLLTSSSAAICYEFTTYKLPNAAFTHAGLTTRYRTKACVNVFLRYQGLAIKTAGMKFEF